MIGDFTAGKTVIVRFNTHQADGTPITLAGTPAISVYKNSTTESTTGVSLTVDYDGRTGLHHVAVDTSADGTFYAAGNDFDLIITTGTVDSISVVGTKVGSFSLANRAALRPTTADRTLDVSSGGEAGLDWSNIGSPTTTVNLSGTTVKTATDVETDTADIQSRLPAALTGDGNIKADTLYLGGTLQTGRDIGSSVLLSSGTGTGQVKLASGYVAPNWGDVGNPTTTVNLSGTTVKTVTDVEADTADIQSRLPAALTGDGNIKADTLRLGGTLQTGRDIGSSVLLSSGTGTGQVKLSSGYVAPNWGDVGNPTTTVGLSGTTVKTATDVETDTTDIQSRLPAALTVDGNIKADTLRLGGDAQSLADLKDFADTGYDPATHKIQGVALLDAIANGALSSDNFTTGTLNASATGILELITLAVRFLIKPSDQTKQVGVTPAELTMYEDNGVTPLVKMQVYDDGTTFSKGGIEAP
mgnify:CR=1 FL=1